MSEIVKKQSEMLHHINDLPHIYELEDMFLFMKQYKHLYIYGKFLEAELLAKYVEQCGFAVDGYAVNYIPSDEECFSLKRRVVRNIDNVMEDLYTGIIVAEPDGVYDSIIPRFRNARYKSYFLLTEYNKRSIAYQMTPREKIGMGFEVNLVDHCNLSCQMCDHFSQLSKEKFIDVDQYERDLREMGRIFEHEIGAISLLGGEPTLHPDIIRIMEATRREFPNCQLIVLTNGILLNKMENTPEGNFWEACHKLDVHISVTVYPIKLDYELIEKLGEKYGVPVWMSSDIHSHSQKMQPKVSDKHTMRLDGSVSDFYFINCLYFNKFNVLKEGKYYMCPVEAHIDVFNEAFNQNLPYLEGDYLDIYKVKDWHEISEFSAKRIPFCRHCDLKNWHPHSEWKSSSKDINEYV